MTLDTNDPNVREAQRGFAEAAGLAFDGQLSQRHDDLSPDLREMATYVGQGLKDELELASLNFKDCRDPEALGRLLVILRGKLGYPGVKQLLDEFIAQVEDWFIESTGNEWEVELPGVGVFVRHSGKKRTHWKSDQIFDDLYHVVLSQPDVNPETGEKVPPEERVLEALRGAAGIAYWRTRALKKWGLPVEEYCETNVGRASVEIK